MIRLYSDNMQDEGVGVGGGGIRKTGTHDRQGWRFVEGREGAVAQAQNAVGFPVYSKG